MLTTATIDVLSDIGATLNWENTGSIGSIALDDISTLNVKANLSTSSFALKYQLEYGFFPLGINFNSDGTIQGKVTSGFVGTYTFAVSALDASGYKYLNDVFTLETVSTTSTNFTNFYFKTYLNLEKRKEYSTFINDRKIFLPELIYRPRDQYFGVQRELKLVLHYGVEEKIDDIDYVYTLQNNFSRRNIKLGKLKTAIAIENNKKLYEIIYVEVLDDLNSSNTATSFIFNGNTYYPASINNMRRAFQDSNVIKTTETLNPKFTKNAQPATYKILRYIPFVPICYCIPDKSPILMKKIKDSGFQFNRINFDIDRVHIEKSTLTLENKYLLFEKRN